VIVRTSVAGQTFGEALTEHAHWAVIQPVATLLLLAPFVAVAILSAAMEKDIRRRSAVAIFGAAALALIFLYFRGYNAAEQFARQRMWTAATFSTAFLPLKAIVVVLLALAASAVATRFDPQTRTSNH
jgi:biotin transporter BioY